MNYGNRNKSFRKRVLVFSLLGAVALLLLLGVVLNAVGNSVEEHKTSQILFEDADTGTKFKYETGTLGVYIILEDSSLSLSLNSADNLDVSLTTSNGKKYAVCSACSVCSSGCASKPSSITWLGFRKLPSKFESTIKELKKALGLAIVRHSPSPNIDWKTMMEQCSWVKVEGKVSGELARKYCLSSPITVELKQGVNVPIDSHSLTVSELVTSDNTTSVVLRTEDLEIDEIELYDMSWNKINSNSFLVQESKHPASIVGKSFHHEFDKKYSKIQIVITRKEVVKKFYVPINLKLDKDRKIIPE